MSTCKPTLHLNPKIRSATTNINNVSSSLSLFWKQHITWLSAMWFVLCASLVYKYNDLIGIFLSFLASFVLAWCFQNILQKPLEIIQLTASSSSMALNKNIDKTKSVAKSMITHPNSEWRNFHSNVKDLVGVSACLISLFLMQQQEISFSEFHALTVSTGYLAFDLWYSALFCRPIPPPILSILEDCITLTVGLVNLTLYQTSLTKFHNWIQLWTFYKTLTLLLSFATRRFMSSGRFTATSSPKSTIWTVHGVEYDLSGFVHPGGSEALELGRGRDCTALFESYHPFTQKHRYGFCWSIVMIFSFTTTTK
jgi:hypothetical protein